MIKFDELKACILKVENVSKAPAVVNMYVPNKDSMPYTLSAGASFKVTTLSAGETYFYLAQTKDSALNITVEQ